MLVFKRLTTLQKLFLLCFKLALGLVYWFWFWGSQNGLQAFSKTPSPALLVNW